MEGIAMELLGLVIALCGILYHLGRIASALERKRGD